MTYIKKITILIIFSLMSLISVAKNHEFNNLVVFGDSLSDIGNIKRSDNNISKFIYRANDNKLYIEYLAKIFTGKNIEPNILGGTNFAVVNSTTYYDENCLICISSKYIQDNHTVNKNDLYVVWSGANDFNNYIFNNSINPYESSKNIQYVVNNLIDANAKYVIIPNMFEVGMTPLVSFLPYYVYDKIAISLFDNKISAFILPFGLSILPVIPMLFLNKYAKKFFIENIFRNKIDVVPQNMTGHEYINNIMGNYYKKILFGKNIYNIIFNSFKLFTQEFNKSLESNLQSINGNIVFIDINKLFNEIIDNPKFYGIDYIILPKCDIRHTLYGADNCYYANIDNNKGNYLWSDQVHPSEFMHKIYAQYIESVFNAPVLLSSITRQLDSFTKHNNDYIFNQLINLNSSNNINNLISFVSIDGNVSKIGAPYDYDSRTTNTNSLNIGFSYTLNTKLLLGAMLNAGYGNYKPYDNFKYRYNSQILNLFSKYQYDNNLFFGANINIGRIEANNIKRTICLGKGKHIEEGNTKGSNIGLNLTGAYERQYKDNITLTPYISLNLNNYKVNGFYEKENRSTSMKYGKSSTTQKDIKLALRATKQNNNNLNSFIELGVTQPIDNNPIKIKSSLKNTKVSFVREIYNDKKPTLNLALGLKKKLKNNLNLNTNLNYKINSNKQQQLYYSLEISLKF